MLFYIYEKQHLPKTDGINVCGKLLAMAWAAIFLSVRNSS